MGGSIASADTLIDTPEGYIEYLEEKVLEEKANTLNSLSPVKSSVEQELKAFKELSPVEQKEFLDLINDPAVLDEIWSSFDLLSSSDSESISLYDGKVVITEEEVNNINDIKPQNIFYNEHEDTRIATITINNINVVRTYAYMQWTSRGDRTQYCCDVVSVNDTDHGVVQNYIPLQQLDPSPRRPYISGTVGIFSVAWHISYNYEGIGIGARTVVHEMTAIGTGDSSGRLYNL